MTNFITDRYNDFRSTARKNILANGQSYMWYLTMASLCIILYVIYSYIDTNTLSIKTLYVAAALVTANASIINILEKADADVSTGVDSDKEK